LRQDLSFLVFVRPSHSTTPGINHREFGRLTLQHWHFPEPIIEAQKNFGPQALTEESSELCRLLEIARICTQLFLGAEENFAVLKEIARMLKMDLDRLSEILSEVFFKVEEMARELRLQINSNQDLLEVMEKANRSRPCSFPWILRPFRNLFTSYWTWQPGWLKKRTNRSACPWKSVLTRRRSG
jgi:hypothetical protein